MMRVRRRALWVAPALGALAALGGAWPGRVLAGAQAEEPLADSVRTALSAAIASAAPPRPTFENTESRMAYLRWLGATSEELAAHLPSMASSGVDSVDMFMAAHPTDFCSRRLSHSM